VAGDVFGGRARGVQRDVVAPLRCMCTHGSGLFPSGSPVADLSLTCR
jgi:hypothetical protein